MPRLCLLLTLLLALGAASAAQAQDAFLGVLPDGRTSARFSENAFPAVVLGDFPGLPEGERIAALGHDVLVTRSGRIFRLAPASRRVTPTAGRVGQLSGDASVMSVPGGVRVITSTGLDVTASPDTGQVVAGPGLRLLDGTPVRGVFDLLPDGRVTGIETTRSRLVTETAPGSAVMTEQPLTTARATRFESLLSPSHFSVDGDRGVLVTRLSKVHLPQSRFISVDLATGAVRGESGTYLYRMFAAAISLGPAPPDRAAPVLRNIRVPRTISVRRMNAKPTGFALRCSEGCNAIASIVAGRHLVAYGSATRDDAGVVAPQLWASARDKRRLSALVGRRLALRVRVADFAGNRRTIQRRFRLTR